MQPEYLERSLLVTSALKINTFKKSLSLPADINLLDLEDAVPEEQKEEARQNIKHLMLDPSIKKITAIRMNRVNTLNGILDLCTLCDMNHHFDIIVLPKVEYAHEIEYIDKILTSENINCCIWAILETPIGVNNAMDIAHSSNRLTSLSFGAADYAMELGVDLTWENLLPARTQVVMAARSASLKITDNPTFNLDDNKMLLFEAKKAKEIGFTGKIAIHPSQLEWINKIFKVDQKSIKWAKKVIELQKNTNTNIGIVDGSMIGPPFIRKAKNILEEFEKEQS